MSASSSMAGSGSGDFAEEYGGESAFLSLLRFEPAMARADRGDRTRTLEQSGEGAGVEMLARARQYRMEGRWWSRASSVVPIARKGRSCRSRE